MFLLLEHAGRQGVMAENLHLYAEISNSSDPLIGEAFHAFRSPCFLQLLLKPCLTLIVKLVD